MDIRDYVALPDLRRDTEALWKKKPIVSSAVGGIPSQVIHKHTGLLAHSIEGTAYQIRLTSTCGNIS